jgi:hypothetical protein
MSCRLALASLIPAGLLTGALYLPASSPQPPTPHSAGPRLNVPYELVAIGGATTFRDTSGLGRHLAEGQCVQIPVVSEFTFLSHERYTSRDSLEAYCRKGEGLTRSTASSHTTGAYWADHDEICLSSAYSPGALGGGDACSSGLSAGFSGDTLKLPQDCDGPTFAYLPNRGGELANRPVKQDQYWYQPCG